MPRITVEGAVEIQYLKDRIVAWSREHPALVRKALTSGVRMMKSEVLRNMDRKLHHRKGHLRSSINTHIAMMPGLVDATVFAMPGSGGLQPVKLRALERGSFRMHPGQIPYLVFSGRPRFISVEKARELERRGKFTPRTRGPYAIRIPKKPMFRPAFNKYKEKIPRMILAEILAGLKTGRAA